MIHGIEITHRPGRNNKIKWECRCGAWDKSKSITKGYQSAARHMEVTNPQCTGTTIPGVLFNYYRSNDVRFE